MSRIKVIFLLAFFLIMAGVIWLNKDDFKHIKKDWKIGIVADNGWGIVTVSPGRRMVNLLKIDKNTDLWIPGETGWINQSRVKDVFKNNNDKNSIKNVFFYNFGFVPDRIEYLGEVENWNDNSDLFKTMGLLSWLNFNYMRDRVIFNEETVDGDLLTKEIYFDEVMMRDFADTDLINEESIKLTVVNASQENGLAGFMSQRLEWAGMSVVSSISESKEIEDSCLMVLGPNTDRSLTQKILLEVMGCKKENNSELSDGEIELYFGENFAKVLKYSSYVRTF